MNDLKDKTRLSMREAAAYLGHSYSWIHANHRVLGLGGYPAVPEFSLARRSHASRSSLSKYQRPPMGYPPLRHNKKGRVRL